MRRARIAIGALAVWASVVGVPLGFQSGTPQFRGRVDGVRVHAFVDADAATRAALRPENVVLTDNGVRQDIDAVVAPGTVNPVILMDVSTSTGATPASAYFERLRSAGRWIADAMQPDELATVVTFADTVSVRARRAPAAVAANAVASIQPRGATTTAIWDAVVVAAANVRNASGAPWLALMTDGCDNTSWLNVRQAAALLSRADVIVDILGVRPQRGLIFSGLPDYCFGPIEWQIIPESTGGILLRAEKDDIRAQIARRLSDLRSTVLLTYTPKGVRTDDGWHTIKVQLRGVRGKVRAKRGYFAGPG